SFTSIFSPSAAVTAAPNVRPRACATRADCRTGLDGSAWRAAAGNSPPSTLPPEGRPDLTLGRRPSPSGPSGKGRAVPALSFCRPPRRFQIARRRPPSFLTLVVFATISCSCTADLNQDDSSLRRLPRRREILTPLSGAFVCSDCMDLGVLRLETVFTTNNFKPHESLRFRSFIRASNRHF